MGNPKYRKQMEKLEKEIEENEDEGEETISPEDIHLGVLVKERYKHYFQGIEVKTLTPKIIEELIKKLSMDDLPMCLGLAPSYLSSSFHSDDFILLLKINDIQGVASGKINDDSFMHINVFCTDSASYNLLGSYMINFLKTIVYREYLSNPNIDYHAITLDSVYTKKTIEFYERNGFRHPEQFNSDDSDEQHDMTYIWRAEYGAPDFRPIPIKRYLRGKYKRRALAKFKSVKEIGSPKVTTPRRYKTGKGTKRR